MNKIKKWIILVVSVVVLTILDQMTKIWAVSTLKGKDAIVLIRGMLELRYLENRGAAFGILQGRAIPLLIFTIVLAVVIGYVYAKVPDSRRYRFLQGSLIFLLAGAAGNMIDRFVNQYVVDFIYVSCIDFPIFNVADCYVTVSVIVIAVLYLFIYKEEEIILFSKKEK